MTAIEADAVVKQYPGVRALDGVSFRVERGEIVGLLGPNGAGKTTLLRILSGALAPSSGRAAVDGRDVVEDSLEVRRRLGYLPENAPLYPEMTPRRYLSFMASVRGLAADGDEVARAVDRCGIDDVLDRRIDELSKGYRQRVGLAQAILHWPPILLLDEPTSGLDPSQIAEIRTLIREIGRERTVLLSSHILAEVEASCDRVLIIDHGRLRAAGTPGELARQVERRQRLIVELEGAPAAAAAVAFGALDGVDEAVARDERTVALTTDGDQRAAVFRAAVEAGWTLLELRSEARSLESVYLRLTGAAGGDFVDRDGGGGGGEPA